jgi:hypothetical protein
MINDNVPSVTSLEYLLELKIVLRFVDLVSIMEVNQLLSTKIKMDTDYVQVVMIIKYLEDMRLMQCIVNLVQSKKLTFLVMLINRELAIEYVIIVRDLRYLVIP